jgi:hypothetical protein
MLIDRGGPYDYTFLWPTSARKTAWCLLPRDKFGNTGVTAPA